MTWEQSLKLPGSVQIGYLASFMRRFDWWELRPAPQVLVEQPGEREARLFVSALAAGDDRLMLVYFPAPIHARLANHFGRSYAAEWFDPVTNASKPAGVLGPDLVIDVNPPFTEDAVLVLRRK